MNSENRIIFSSSTLHTHEYLHEYIHEESERRGGRSEKMREDDWRGGEGRKMREEDSGWRGEGKDRAFKTLKIRSL
jgi:hypothetical protein